jgi:DNA-binding NtrC family response regulator
MPTVLIVEGQRDVVQPLAHELELRQWRVLGASSIIEAKRVAEGIHIDVVLTDEVLPEGKGIQIENTFRAEEQLEDTPFVYMVRDPNVSRTLQGRCLLPKPFTLEEAMDLLSSVIHHRSAFDLQGRARLS